MTAPVRFPPSPDAGTAPLAVTKEEIANIYGANFKELFARAPHLLSDVTGTNVLTASAGAPALVEITDGMSFWLVPVADNTGGVTLEIDGLAALDVVDADGETLTAGSLAAGRLYKLAKIGSDLRVFSGGVGAGEGGSSAPGIILEDQKAQNTAGGTATAGSWLKRTLNTSVRNEIPGSVINTTDSEFTLPPGVYVMKYVVPAFGTFQHQGRIFNITDGAVVPGSIGESAYAYYASTSEGLCVVSISASKTFRLEHRVASTYATQGLGYPANITTEKYSFLHIWKVGETASSVQGQPGGPVTLQFEFSTTTTDSDPGDGKLRLNQATQNTATVIRLDNKDSYLNDIAATLAALGASTSKDKAYIRLVKTDDRTKWLLFTLRSIASPTGYKNFTVALTDSSAASPFADGDSVLFEFGQTGDVGLFGGGIAITYAIDTASQADSDPGAGVLRLNQATQNTTTQLFADLLDQHAVDWTSVLDTLDESESVVKGFLRLTARNDHSKWLMFKLTARTTAAGYRKFTVNCVGYSASSPFSNGDIVVMQFARNGDLGQPGGITLRYAFSTTTTDSDPGNGTLRLDNATQNAATTLRADLLDLLGSDWSSYLATIADSTNSVKGFVLLQGFNNPAKFLLFRISALASPSGYKNITVVPVASSDANPFSNGDTITASFTRSGDRGDVAAAIGFDFDTSTSDSDPGTGKFRANHATFASVTKLFIDNSERGGSSVTTWLDTFDDSTNTVKGRLTAVCLSDPTKFATFRVTGSVVDGTGYRKIDVTPLSHNGFPWSASLGFAFSFQDAGDKGADGGGGGTAAEDLRAILLNSIQLGKLTGAGGYQRPGPMFADGFADSGGIDGNTNGEVDTTNKWLKPTLSGGALYTNPGGTGNRGTGQPFVITPTTDLLITDGTIGELIDGTTTTASGLYFNDAQAVSGKYIRFVLPTAKVINEIRIKQQTGAGGTAVFKTQGWDGSSWVDLPGGNWNWDQTQATLTISVNAANNTAYSEYRFLGVSGSIRWYYIDEVEFKIGDPATTGNMTVTSAAITADATVNSIIPLLLVKIVDAITLNTDLTLEVSADGGSNWFSVTLIDLGTVKSGYKVYGPSAPIDTSTHAGTSPKMRTKTLNNKMVHFPGAAMKWAA